jgi:hypothetical protein
MYGSQKLISVGDLGDNLLRSRPGHLSELIDSMCMTQLVSEPTHYTRHSESLIDQYKYQGLVKVPCGS